MLLKRLEIKDCIQLLSNGVSKFTWSPLEGVTGILGSNGSGKSTIMRLAAPLSGIREHFKEGGGVTTIYEHDGSEIEAGYTHVKGKLVHFFFVNGENINRGGTGKEQDEIASQSLGYTKTIHQCLTGQLRFSRLPVNKRAQLLQEVVSIDVSEAEKVYDKLKQKLSADKANYAHVSSKLIAHEHNYLSEDERLNLEELIHSTSNALEHLRKKAFQHSNAPMEALWRRYNTLVSEIDENAKRILKKRFMTKPACLNNEEELSFQLFTLENKYTNLNQSITDNSKEFLELKGSIDSVGAEDLEETTRKKIEDLKVELEEYVGNTVNVNDIGELDNNIYSFESLTDHFNHDFVLEAHYNDDDLLIQTRSHINNELARVNDEYLKNNNALEAGVNWLARVKASDKERCPKCSHEYWKDYDPKDVARIEAGVKDKEQLKVSLHIELEKLRQESHRINHLHNELDRITFLVDGLPELSKSLITPYIYNGTSYRSLLLNKGSLVSQANTILNTLKLTKSIAVTKQQLHTQEEILARVVKAKEGNIYTQLSERHQALELLIDKDIQEKHVLELDIAEAEKYIKEQELLGQYHASLTTKLATAGEIACDIIQDYEYEYGETVYKKLQSEIANSNELLSKAKAAATLRDAYMEDMKQLDANIQQTTRLMKALSPATGLIAKELTNGINAFTSMMNNLLSELWTYDMEILPCSLDRGKLTYRFPMTVKGQSGLKDISEGSDGQQQIIDFIFSILYINQKGLKNFPLILDEPGTGLDHAHLNTFFAYVRQMAVEGVCSQIFLISHLFGILGDFKDTDLVVMDEENVSGLNGVSFNENVEIY